MTIQFISINPLSRTATIMYKDGNMITAQADDIFEFMRFAKQCHLTCHRMHERNGIRVFEF